MDELRTHLEELMEENPQMEVSMLTDRLGSPDQIATWAAAAYRRRTFVGRHPVLAFLVAPIPCVIACLAALTLSVGALGSLLSDSWLHSPSGTAFATFSLALFTWSLRLLPFVVLVAVFQRAAYRAGCDWRWGVAAALLLTLFAATFAVDYQAPTGIPDSGRFSVGLTLPPGPMQMVQVALPALITAILARRYGRSNIPQLSW
jgi:hypothetical protein